MKDIKNVLLVTSNYHPEIGGPAKFTYNFSHWLQTNNYKTAIFTTIPKNKETFLNSKIYGISRKHHIFMRIFYLVKFLRLKHKKSRIIVNGLFYEVFMARLFLRFKYVTKVPSDIVWDRAVNKKKTSLSVDQFQNNEPIIFRIHRKIFTQTLQKSEYVIVPTKHLSDLVINWGIDSTKVRLISNSTFISKKVKHRIKNSFDIVVVNRLIPLKGVFEILQACRKLNLSINILGSGPELSNLQKFVEAGKIRAKFEGDVSHPEVIRKLKNSTIFVLNSIHEGSPNALIEALSLGCVCVVRENSGTTELIEDLNNGILIGKRRSLEDGIIAALKDLRLRKTIGRNAYMYSLKNLNSKNNFQSILNLLNQE